MSVSTEEIDLNPPPGPRRGIFFLHPTQNAGFVPLRVGRHVLGRKPSASLSLAGRAVSWEHAAVECTPQGALRIEDLGSTNGVLINGSPVDEADLSDGAVVRLGDFLGVITPDFDAPQSDDVASEAERLGIYLGPFTRAALQPAIDAAPTSPVAAIVIRGETGTGKRTVARLFHQLFRAQAAFLEIDCATPAEELSACLFGTGAATGALDDPQSGTVYLANLTLAPASIEQRLAAALNARATQRAFGLPLLIFGSQEGLAGTVDDGLHAALQAHAADTAFTLPPLRHRVPEVPGIFRLLLHTLGKGRVPGRSTELIERLCLYDWPGNVLEMRMLVERIVAWHGDEIRLRTSHLPPHMQAPEQGLVTSPGMRQPGLDPLKVLDALRGCDGIIGKAAQQLRISRAQAYGLIDRIGKAPGRSNL